MKKLYKKNSYGYEHQDPDARLDKKTIDKYEKEYGINTNVHRSCINCQIRQIDKYKNHPEGGDKFKVRCNFIPKGLPPGTGKRIKEIVVSNDMDEERAKKLLLSTIDPVAWAEIMFGFSDSDPKWSLRNYQKEQIRCSALRFACREGRRSGKTFAMALKLAHLAFNKTIVKGLDSHGKEVSGGPDIMVVTPYQAQLTNIFNEIESLIKRNVELRAEITSGTGDSLYVKTPLFKMDFKNGARIRGFVSGLGIKEDGSGGGTIRGASADIIYLDEMDMIPEDILDKVITPILLTQPDVVLLATSTPIGKRGKFYSWCLDRPDFKEDYYPSTVLPHWETIRGELEAESTKESFAAEYMAEFIEGEYGVFKPSHIYGAKRDYTYEQTSNNMFLYTKLGIEESANMLICMGIDWNKNAGTEFYVSGYSPATGLWIGLDAINIPSSEYSGQRWMKEVIRLNYKWKPDWIYADEGYGHTIIEDLHLHAHRLKSSNNLSAIDKQTVKLSERLISFNFSRNIELKDPVDGTTIKKSGKHYIVENAVRILEDSLFIFPESDDILTKQMMNYVVTKVSKLTGKPVFGADNDRVGDHRLDAMMLSLAGLALEVSVYSGRNLPITRPRFVSGTDNKGSYNSPGDEADRILKSVKKSGIPGQTNILKIMRGGSEEEDKAVKQKYRAAELLKRGGFVRRSRGDIGKHMKRESESIFEGLAKRSNHTRGHEMDLEEINTVKTLQKPHRSAGKPVRRLNKKKRSWK